MKLDDILGGAVADLPKTRTTKDIIKAYREMTEQYIRQVSLLEPHDDVAISVRGRLREMEFASVRLRESLEAAFAGKPDRHYKCVEEVLGLFGEDIAKLASVDVDRASMPTLYRARKSNPSAVLSRKEMFHIPFELREIVGTQRYSYPGLPCLYAGASLYVCWEELRRPDFNQMHVVGVRLREGETIKVLDLSHRPKWLTEDYQGALYHVGRVKEIRQAVAITWPLLAACSMRPVPHSDEGVYFRSEYIVPQSVLRWLLDREEFDGLRYFSCRALDKGANRLAVNHVYPARGFGSSGHCDRLRRKFEMTEPVSWQYVLAAPPQRGIRANTNIHYEFGVSRDGSGVYSNSLFCKVELFLDSMEFAAVL